MNLLATLRGRFAGGLLELGVSPAEAVELLDMIRPTADAKFGDYQANFAMPLKNRLGKPPREIAADILARVNVDDLCHPPEVAGPGFINLKLRP